MGTKDKFCFKTERSVQDIISPIAQLCSATITGRKLWTGTGWKSRLSIWGDGIQQIRKRLTSICRSQRIQARILCYHRVTDNPNRHPKLLPWSVSTQAFYRQMRLLSRLGYRGITLRELVDAFESGTPLGRVIVLTFDDGFLDNLTEATPILEEFGFQATVFAVADYVGKRDDWNQHFGGKMGKLATWEQLREMTNRGWEIGYHTESHPDLNALSGKQLENELVDGRTTIEQKLGLPVETVAYPFGGYNQQVHQLTANSGVRAAVRVGTARNGRKIPYVRVPAARVQSDRFALPRATVEWNDSLLEFALIAVMGFPPRRSWTKAFRKMTAYGRQHIARKLFTS